MLIKSFSRALQALQAIKDTQCLSGSIVSKEEALLKAMQLMIEQKQELTQMAEEIKQLTAQVTTSGTGFYTVAGYCSLKGRRVDSSIALTKGKECSRVSREMGVMIGKAPDARYGQVNTYHKDILLMVLGW